MSEPARIIPFEPRPMGRPSWQAQQATIERLRNRLADQAEEITALHLERVADVDVLAPLVRRLVIATQAAGLVVASQLAMAADSHLGRMGRREGGAA